MLSVVRGGNALVAAAAVAAAVAYAAAGFHLPFALHSACDGTSFDWPFACDSYFEPEFAAAAVASCHSEAFGLWLLRRPLRSILQNIRGLN